MAGEMKHILIFSGTTEGRTLSELLAEHGIEHGVCVATEYGELVMQKNLLVTIHQGRLDFNEMKQLIMREKYGIIIDATHPYATKVTETIIKCVEDIKEKKEIIYLRLNRDTGLKESEKNSCTIFEDNAQCAKYLEHTEGNILLTTGSKELPEYLQGNLKDRLYVRVLPGVESIRICLENGISPNRIIAMQGPFSKEMNIALLREYKISYMVSKQAGKAGGFEEKRQAASEKNIPFLVVKKKQEQEQRKSYNFSEICSYLSQILTVDFQIKEQVEKKHFTVYLAGIGLGSKDSLTVETKKIIEEADYIAGARRIIAPYKHKVQSLESYDTEEIASWILEKYNSSTGDKKAVVLFSGDSGFYSGCTKLNEYLKNEKEKQGMDINIKILPGISSVQAMSAHTGIPWQKFFIESIHGKTKENTWKECVLQWVKCHCYVFLLVSGDKDVRMIGELLQNDTDNIGESCRITLAYQLSYENEAIQTLTPLQCTQIHKQGLYCMLIQNTSEKISDIKENITENQENKIIVPCMKDEFFIRGSVPMTKEEIRHLSICKLELEQESVLYDIGSGTGSIAVEAAAVMPQGVVYAVEKNPEGIELIKKNQKKSHCHNITVIEGTAPQILSELPTPTHAFIGGSSGSLWEILDILLQKNNHMRIVITAVSLQTVTQLQEISDRYKIKNMALTQVQISHYKKMGTYFMPKAENPIYICSFAFDGGN